MDKICGDWIKFIAAQFQKESWNRVKMTLFISRTRKEFANFSECGWDKIDQLWRWGRWEKKQIRRITWWKFCGDVLNFVFEKVKESVGKGRCIWRLWKCV